MEILGQNVELVGQVSYYDPRVHPPWLPCSHLFEQKEFFPPANLKPKPMSRELVPQPRPAMDDMKPIDPRLFEWFHQRMVHSTPNGFLPMNNPGGLAGVPPSMMPYPGAHLDGKLASRRRTAQFGYPPVSMGMPAENLALYNRIPKTGQNFYQNEVFNNNMMQSALFKGHLNAATTQHAAEQVPAYAADNDNLSV